ncbi:MAG: hypothetical protein AAGI53_04820 [Planctomycetota bacterium]
MSLPESITVELQSSSGIWSTAKDIITALTPLVSVGIAAVLSDRLLRDRKSRDLAEDVRLVVSQRVEPFFRSGDALVAKLSTLAQADFVSVLPQQHGAARPLTENIVLLNLEYLVAAFWAQIELLLSDAQSVRLREDARGQAMLALASAIEHRHVSLLPREYQRAIGSALIDRDESGATRVVNFFEYCKIRSDPEVSRVIDVLRDEVLMPALKRNRRAVQSLVLMCTVVHYGLDCLLAADDAVLGNTGDGDIVSLRPFQRDTIYNKLSQRSRRDAESIERFFEGIKDAPQIRLYTRPTTMINGELVRKI